MAKKANVTDASMAGDEQLEQAGIVYRAPEDLKPWPTNSRVHDEKQLAVLVASIRKFGFTSVIITNEDGVILAGHGRVEAAKRAGLASIPTRPVVGWSDTQQRAFVLADNKIALLASWDEAILRSEIKILCNEDFSIETTGFSTAEVDIIIDDVAVSESDNLDDLQPEDLAEILVSKLGDVWNLGDHTIICADALVRESYMHLMQGETAQMVITDPPYNVAVNGHVCGNGKIQHDEFQMASGEMDSGQFIDFLGAAFARIEEFTGDGAIVYSFMDWRHQMEILAAAEPIFGPLRQLCVWVKDNGGMGTFYRSQHELVFIFKKGQAKHINNFGLGQHGRYRTNVWKYPGVNTFKGKGHELLKMHPTVKPVSMIADAMRDCSNRKGLILDPFAGSGTVIVAAERAGRRARAMELEPKYVDVAIRRWERITGNPAIHQETGMTFTEMSLNGRPAEEKNDE
jgi:DNA modification methylase